MSKIESNATRESAYRDDICHAMTILSSYREQVVRAIYFPVRGDESFPVCNIRTKSTREKMDKVSENGICFPLQYVAFPLSLISMTLQLTYRPVNCTSWRHLLCWII